MCKNFKIWNIRIQGLFKDFQGPRFFPKFKEFQGLLKDPMNSVHQDGVIIRAVLESSHYLEI